MKTMIAPRIPTIPTATPPKIVPVFEDSAAAAAPPAAVEFKDVEGVEVGVGNAVYIKRGLDVAEKLNGLGEKVPVKLIVPKAVMVADQDWRVVALAVKVPLMVPLTVAVAVAVCVSVAVPVPVDAAVPLPV
jgi:hypothetical protein